MQSELPFVDETFGLSQLGGNETLFYRMLTKFRREFENTPAEVINLLKNNEFDAAKIKVHTTKGISGNLGLTALFECAKKFDKQIKERVDDKNTANEFEAIMLKTCETIDAISSRSEGGSEEAQINVVSNAKESLKQKLQRHEFIDDGELRDLIAGIDLSEQHKTALLDAIEELRYEEALEIIASS